MSTISMHKAPWQSSKGLWWLTFILSAVLYLLTCQRGVSWQDSGMFQWRILNGDFTGNLGLALAHPLYIAIGKLFMWFPLGDVSFRLNFLSGMGMAVALANLSAVLLLLTEKRWIGFIISAILALTHTAWWLATIAEVYTLSLAGLTAELWLLILLLRSPRWYLLAGLAFVNGLGVSVHNLALLPLPVYITVALLLINRKRLPFWSAIIAAVCYLIGAAPYLGLVIISAWYSGNIWDSVLSAVFGQYAAAVLNLNPWTADFKINAVLCAMNFINVLLPLAIVGWIHFRKRLGNLMANALGAITLIELIFAARYNVPDQFTFLLSSLCMIAIASGVGLWVLSDLAKSWRNTAVLTCMASIIIQPLFYAAMPRLVEASGINLNRARLLPFRNELRYWLVPWKHNEHSAELFAGAALKQAAPDGVILGDSTSVYPLFLVQSLKGLTPSVAVQYKNKPLRHYSADPQLFRNCLGNRVFYVVCPFPGYIAPRLIEDAEFIRAENEVLYRVKWKH